MLKAGSKRRMSKMECAEKKRINADKDAALAARFEEIKRLESELLKANEFAVELKSQKDIVDHLKAEGHITLQDDGSVSIA
jgi:hypothetical protein